MKVMQRFATSYTRKFDHRRDYFWLKPARYQSMVLVPQLIHCYILEPELKVHMVIPMCSMISNCIKPTSIWLD